ncbi:hypothetical protein PIB30_106509 [Stylosanthes scabra]|uniref:Uncharacterized protein n=1 Tax=Stylosanthes scabra TaxID=79078 RepID=A0ABU6T179_9FABA|nr:hypothetical protein [Stylosanthes scabra]
MEMQRIPVTMANLAIHRQREEEMNQERMRHNQIIQEATAQQAKKNKQRQIKRSCARFLRRGNRRDKPIIEFDPEIEKTLKKNRSRIKAQRALQFEQEEANSEEGASEKSSV